MTGNAGHLDIVHGQYHAATAASAGHRSADLRKLAEIASRSPQRFWYGGRQQLGFTQCVQRFAREAGFTINGRGGLGGNLRCDSLGLVQEKGGCGHKMAMILVCLRSRGELHHTGERSIASGRENVSHTDSKTANRARNWLG